MSRAGSQTFGIRMIPQFRCWKTSIESCGRRINGGVRHDISLALNLVPFLLLLLAPIPTLGAPFTTGFHFPNFSSSDDSVTFVQDAFIDDAKIYLTSKKIFTLTENFTVPLSHGIGRAFYRMPIQGRHPITRQPQSFSTTFIFSISNPQQLELGDGLAFIITNNNSIIGSGGAYLGVLDQTSNGLQSAHIFAVEFDTWKNPELLDMDGNHVGVDLDSMVSEYASSAGYWDGNNHFIPMSLTALRLQAWIDYSSSDEVIRISISPTLGSKPRRPLLSVPVNLSTTMGDEMFVGFSAATGDLSSEHMIHAWSLNMSGPAQDFEVPNHDDSDSEVTQTQNLIPKRQEQDPDPVSLLHPLYWGLGCLVGVLVIVGVAAACRLATWRKETVKVHVGDPEAVVLPPDLVHDAARAQANLNISKILAEAHQRAVEEEERRNSSSFVHLGESQESIAGAQSSGCR